MKELPEGYDLRQAYNDLMYLGVRLKTLEDFVFEELLPDLGTMASRAFKLAYLEMLAEMLKVLHKSSITTRLTFLEESLDGLQTHYTTSTLKEIETLKGRMVDKYTID